MNFGLFSAYGEGAKVMSYSDNVGEQIKMRGRILQDIFSTLVQYFFLVQRSKEL